MIARLSELLAALRGAGVPIGVREELRLRHALAALPEAPEGDPERLLRALLRSVLARSEEERQAVDHVLGAWLPEGPPPEPAPGPRIEPGPPPGPRWEAPPRWRRALLLVAVLLLPFLPGPPRIEPDGEIAPSGQKGPDRVEAGPAVHVQPVFAPPTTYRGLRAEISVSGEASAPPLLPLLLGALAALTMGGLWLVLRRRGLLPVPVLGPLRPGPGRVLANTPRQAGVFLGRRDEEVLVWGIDRFLSDEPTRRLDVAATVWATVAAAGVPSPRFHLARHQREVWIWQDERLLSDGVGADVVRLVEEVGEALRRAGLKLRKADFRDVPDVLYGARGRRFQPGEVDERREAALVAVFTDGKGLRARLRSEAGRGPVLSLLRTLSGWPRLVFVDPSGGAYNLRAELRPRGIEVIRPEQVAAFLGLSTLPAERAGADELLFGDLRVWAAYCAISPQPVDEETAHALRAELALDGVSAWQIGVLRREGAGVGGRLSWPVHAPEQAWDRARLLSFLVAAGPWREAVAFFRARLRREEERRAAGHTEAHPWEGTAAQMNLKVERLLLDLWDVPEEAAKGLFALHGAAGSPVRRAIERALGELAPRECAAADVVVLPWELRGCGPEAQVMLYRMGLARGQLRGVASLRRPGRHLAALGLCAGVVVAAGVAALRQGRAEAPRIEEVGAQRGRVKVVAEGRGRYEVWAWTRQQVWSRGVGAGARVRIDWVGAELPCRQDLGDGVVRRWCGDAAPGGWEGARQVAVVAADEGEAGVLAARLLESGSAGEVVVGARAAARVVLHPALGRDEQVLWVVKAGQEALPGTGAVVEGGDWAELADRLHFAGPKGLPVAEVWAEARRLGEGAVRLFGACPRVSGTVGGIDMVRVCGGIFWMGSKEGDKDEQPVHKVRVSPFWMGTREVSRAEVGDKEEGQMPKADVSWDEARAFCQKRGLVLPSEAEWEYAARGVDGRRYPWGDEAPDEGRAVFGRPIEDVRIIDGRVDYGGKPDPVGKHPGGAGPFGTLDQAGNLWEWVEDWYKGEVYKERSDKTSVNPLTTDSSSGARVLRGGSFVSVPRGLRSADRLRYEPRNGFGNFGFRCAWSPARRP